MTPYTGKCHCGQTEWTVDLEQDQKAHVLCHCNTCKTLSGGASTMNQIVPKKALNLTKGGGNLRKYAYKGDSGNEVNCYYCPNCTTHVYHHQTVAGPDTIVVRTGLLTQARIDFGVGAEIYGKDKMSWEPKLAQTFEVTPPG